MALKAKRKARAKRASDPLPADETPYARGQVAMKQYVDLLNGRDPGAGKM